ncbi:maleylacetoacetate isomerase [Burkholderia sp. SRS-W-2-2016]|uniref:maleylacetoacetate isomerase n=1 Tax=Burkholderia sp. SRS-W-2-2016 TaxID=1926878 RepID=UPI00094B34FF|nr:maleylacetoacetate isomerase [Burkholderia sp. SRS-W-2-2016]OLL30709.1 maleylacetoacetate isomerase [Burkholderia sp. SRS-W-2-2016]
MTLHGYFRSSASFRVRIALNLKGVPHDQAPVHLLRDGGEQLQPAYRALNPDGLVPSLSVHEEATTSVLTQSLAIIEYLDELYPTPALLPAAPLDRAFVRSVALQIACEIHPLANLRVLKYLSGELHVSDAQRQAWYRHWLEVGFASLEQRLAAEPRVGRFTFGDAPTLADLCIVPQVWNARRFEIPLDAYPTIVRIADHAMTLDAFAAAEPGRQPDANA